MATATEAQLRRLEGLIREKVPGLVRTLRPGAKRASLDKVADLFDGKLPKELEAWFSWHEGETGSGSERLIPGSDWAALSCNEVIKLYRLMSKDVDSEFRFNPAWIPLFEDFSGNYLCLDRQTGAMRAWYHDSPSRPKPYKSLPHLIDRLERAYRSTKKAAGIAPPPATLRWQVAKVPSAANFQKLPGGTVFTAKGSRYTHILRVKLGPDRWLECTEGTVADAVEDWRKCSKRPPSASSGRYGTDFSVRWELTHGARTVKMVAPPRA